MEKKVYCTNCGNSKPIDANFCSICGNSESAVKSKKKNIPKMPSKHQFVYNRIGAWFCDLIVIVIVTLILVELFSSIFDIYGSDVDDLINLLGFVISLIYFAFFESKKSSATLGKRLLKQKVISSDKGSLDFKIALGRAFLKSIPFFIIVSAVMFLFRKDRQTIHDLVMGTKVISVEVSENPEVA